MQSAQKATKFDEIKQSLGLLRRSRSFKVTEFGTNRKLICDFLLVINTNLAPILHRLRDIAFDRSKIGCTNVTDDRQTDGRTMTYSEREREFTQIR